MNALDLEQALENVTPEDMKTRPLDKAMLIRVSIDEKDSIEAIAGALGLSVSGYLRRLHEIAEGKLRPAISQKSKRKK